VSELIPGLYAKVEKDVTTADTALMLGSGDVEVFGTPAVVALCELAAVHAVAPALGPNETTVGSRIEIEHLAPTVVGRTVTGYARVEEVNGRRIGFTVEASDNAGVIARGSHVRVRVDRDVFMANAWDR
jgi:fluoroacetyl-CoA thioesterase